MKKFGLIFLLMLLAFTISAQDYDIDQIEDSFKSFADETAQALPMMAGMGLNWNDAYMGMFPRFGVGLTTGAVFIPMKAFEDVYDLTGDDTLDDMPGIGIPMPMYSIDGRIGVPILPMDVGLKVGVLNPRDMMDITMSYSMFGGDIRYAVIEGNPLLPELSVGVGYTHMSGSISAPIDDQTMDISGYASGAIGNELVVSDTDMLFDWSANVFDFKVQASKKLLLLNLSAGMGYSYGLTSAGGGITNGTVSVDNVTITDAQIDQLEDLTGVSIDDEGVLVNSDVNGGALRLFGGVGLNFPLVKVDFGLNYGLATGTMGLTSNVRLQL